MREPTSHSIAHLSMETSSLKAKTNGTYASIKLCNSDVVDNLLLNAVADDT